MVGAFLPEGVGIGGSLEEEMLKLVEDTQHQQADQPGHVRVLKEGSFACSKRRARLPRRGGKLALKALNDSVLLWSGA